MDPLDDPLSTRPCLMGWEMSIKPYPNWQLRCMDDQDRVFGDGSVQTRTRTPSGGPEPLLSLATTLSI